MFNLADLANFTASTSSEDFLSQKRACITVKMRREIGNAKTTYVVVETKNIPHIKMFSELLLEDLKEIQTKLESSGTLCDIIVTTKAFV